jgi:hypothetical protein
MREHPLAPSLPQSIDLGPAAATVTIEEGAGLFGRQVKKVRPVQVNITTAFWRVRVTTVERTEHDPI